MSALQKGSHIATPPVRTSPLVNYAMQGLRRCWMPEMGRYSYRFCFDVESNEWIPESNAFYALK
jgi:hypothetical protein